MSLYRFFGKSSERSDLPSPSTGVLSHSLGPAAIKAANEAVEHARNKTRKRRGSYAKFTPEQQAAIAKYASIHGNQAAVVKFSKELEVQLKVTTVQTWKTKYLAELRRKQSAGETGDLTINSLPLKKRGRPLLLGEKLDSEVKSYIQAVRERGGVVTTSIAMAAATAIVQKADRNLLAENGGHIAITNNWAKSLLYRMNFVKRRGSSTAKLTVANFEAVKEQFLIDVNAVVEMEDIPSQLVINWDQTGISIVPGSSWTMEAKGSKRVEIVGMGDKRQITAVLCGAMSGEFLPPQLIYQGKTTACLPRHKFPTDWHVTYTHNHWSNEDTMIEYIKSIILPYVERKRTELELSRDQPALAIFDVFRGQQTEGVLKLLEKNNILVVNVPANCTDRLQPMDLSINKSVKEFMRSKFRDWYSEQVQHQLCEGKEISPVDLKLSTMKPLGARWLVSLYDYITQNNSIVVNGFKAAGLLC